jgi:hypothetical protein
MMNYQNINTNMSNYIYLFKDSSFVERHSEFNDSTTPSPPPSITFEGEIEKEVVLNQSEINYLYVMANK